MKYKISFEQIQETCAFRTFNGTCTDYYVYGQKCEEEKCPVVDDLKVQGVRLENELLAIFMDKLWVKYPNKMGKTKAEKSYLKTVKKKEDAEELEVVLDCYLEYLEKVEWLSPQNGSTFFNQWQDWRTKFVEEGVLVDE